MQPTKTLNEISKYLLYASDALRGVASSFGMDKHDREALEKYSADILKYFEGLEQLKIKLIAKEQQQQKIQVNAELEYIYEKCKRTTANAQENVRITDARLKEVQKKGTKREVEECKQRLAFYMREYLTAQKSEFMAKRAMTEQGA